jgi:predicted dehydrogenase
LTSIAEREPARSDAPGSGSAGSQSTNTWSIGIIGAGEIVSRLHLPVLKTLSSIRPWWITDVNLERSRSLARAYGGAAIELPSDLANLPEADIILLAIPYGLRPPYYAALRDHRSALYVEKPFARSVEEHRSLCELRAPSQIACGFQRRAMTSVNLVRALVAGQMLGRLERIEFGMGRRGGVRSGTYHSSLGAAGGGAFFETGVHGIDTLLFITAARDAWVEGASVVTADGFDVHVDASVRVVLPDGRSIAGQVTVSGLEDTIDSFRLSFERGTVRFSIFSADLGVTVRVSGVQYAVGSEEFGRIGSSYQCGYTYWTTFLDGLRIGEANWTSAHDSLLTTKIVEEVYAQPRVELC